MFRKREKKEFPPGTFLPNSARIVAITQLCFAFSLLLWCCGQPFMGEHFSLKSRLLIFEYVLGIPNDFTNSAVSKELIQRNYERFKSLPDQLQHTLTKNYNDLKIHFRSSFTQKTMRMIHIFLFEKSHYEIAWIILGIIIPIFLLMKIEGAREVIWILPVLAMAYSLDNYTYGVRYLPSEETRLFPSEELIIKTYLKEPLEKNVIKQREQLLKGWNVYLIEEWARETPSNDLEVFKTQIEKGEYAFTVARAEKLEVKVKSQPFQKEPLLLLILYIVWNFFFAYFINKILKKEVLVSI